MGEVNSDRQEEVFYEWNLYLWFLKQVIKNLRFLDDEISSMCNLSKEIRKVWKTLPRADVGEFNMDNTDWKEKIVQLRKRDRLRRANAIHLHCVVKHEEISGGTFWKSTQAEMLIKKESMQWITKKWTMER